MEFVHLYSDNLKRRRKLVSNLRIRFCSEYTQVEDKTHPNQKNTEHILREDSTDEIKDQDKRGWTAKKSVKQVNSVSDIFKDGNGKKNLNSADHWRCSYWKNLSYEEINKTVG